MKNTLLKVWGIVLTVAILAGLLMVAVPTSAANLSWSTLGSPAVVVTTVANVYAFANNGKTVLSYDGAALNQSLDGGVTWSSSNLGTGLPAGIKSIVIDPTNPVYMVATNGTNVYRSQNSGVNWSTFNPPAALATVTSIDTTTDSWGEVVLVGYDAVANAGGVALYENGTWYTTWAAPFLGTNLANWGTGGNAVSAYAVKLSPNYPNDGAVTAVAGANAGAGIGFKLRTIISSSLITGGTPAWGGDVMDATLSATAAPAVVGTAFASIDMPSDYYWASASTNHVFVGLGDTTSAALYDGVYRADGVLVGTPRVPVLYTGVSTYSIDYQGTSTAGVLAIGQYGNTNVLTSTDAITVSSLTAGSTWITSLKNPTGIAAAPMTFVRFIVVGATTNLYAGTTGAQSGLFLATNANSYASFNGIAFISVGLLTTTSFTTTGGRSNTGLATTFQKLTDTTNAVCMWFKSIDSGATWQEIFSCPSTYSFSASLSPTYATDNTIYLYCGNPANSRIYKSIDGGATWNVNATYGNVAITSLAAIDGTNYWFGNASGVRSTLSTSALVNLNGKAPGPIIAYSPTFMVVQTTTDGDIWVSTDGGVTFTSLGVPAADGGLGFGSLVSTTDVATKTIYILDSAAQTPNILSWTVGTSTAWTQFLSSTILTGTGGINLTGVGGPWIINKMSKATGAWYFVSNSNINGQVWRSTNLAAGSFEAVTGSAFVANTFGAPTASPSIVNDKATGNNTIYDAVGYNGTLVTPNTYNYKWVNFTDSVLAAPAPIAPVASANTSSTVDISWKAVPNATSYDVQIAYDSAFNNIYKSQIAVPSTSTFYPSTIWAQVSLNPGQTYYWRVRVSLASPMASAWSAGVMFTTQLGSVSTSGIDIGRFPTPGATGIATNSFSWGTVAGATSYEFKISTKADFSDIVDSSVGLTGTVYQTLAKLSPGTTYFWEVRAVAGTVTGPWVTATFTTATAAQANPTTAPAPVVTVPQPTFVIPTQPAPVVNVTVPTPTNGSNSNSTPAWAWVVIAIGAVLVIAVIVLIARTRRV
jgi:hypothetical protein